MRQMKLYRKYVCCGIVFRPSLPEKIRNLFMDWYVKAEGQKIMRLSDCGLVHKVNRVMSPKLPLKAYEDLKAFKLFVLDVGLLGCMTDLRQKTLLEGNKLFTEFKGALTEQYVMQQFVTVDGLNVYYYTNERGSCEIDFLVDNGENVIPVEVKAEENLRAKSLRTYKDKFDPEIAVRTSMSDYREEEWLSNLPLYVISEL